MVLLVTQPRRWEYGYAVVSAAKLYKLSYGGIASQIVVVIPIANLDQDKIQITINHAPQARGQ